MLDCVIDVSHFNGVVDYAKVKASGVCAVIVKATQGANWIDPMFHSNLTHAIAAGLLVGAYHFGTGDDAVKQAEHFMLIAGQVPLKVLDFEQNPSGESMTTLQAEQFIGAIGQPPMIYADLNHIKQLAILGQGITDSPLWIAQYKTEDSPEIPENTWSDWTLWQYTESGVVPGINSKVDKSYFNGTQDELEALFT